MDSATHRLPETASQAEVEDLVASLNADPQVNGILVQLPLPKGLNEEAVLNGISLEKDVDGFNPINIGRLVMKGRVPLFIPCTLPAASSYWSAAACRLPAPRQSFSGAATSSAFPWRPCSTIGMRPSRSATAARRT